ncbi:hypothetical protein ACLOJK_017304 [Asimina triloba]
MQLVYARVSLRPTGQSIDIFPFSFVDRTLELPCLLPPALLSPDAENPRIRAMNYLSNAFSLLNLEAEDDKEQTAAAAGSVDPSDSTVAGKSKKKGKRSGKTIIVKNDNETQGSRSEEFRLPLVWIDLEMTGLDTEVDRILEIACIITDGNLTKLMESTNQELCMKAMSDEDWKN